MAVVQEIQALVQNAVSNQANFDPVDFLNIVTEKLQKACGAGGECDSVGPHFLGGQGGYFIAADFLSRNGFVSAAQQLLFGWWNNVGTRQLAERTHIYRAGNAYKLTQLYLRQGDLGAALRWALLTQADDLLHEHGAGGGAGRQWLRTIFGTSEAELGELKSIADDNLKIIKSGNVGVSKTSWFAEDIVVRFALKDIAFEHFFSQPSSVREFPISLPYFRTLLDRVYAPAATTKEKGDALELAAAYLFLLIPGWFPSRNVLDENEGLETDIIISNLNPSSNLTAELLGRHFLVECKNWGNPVQVPDVGYFLHRMRLTHCNFGVIFAVRGITGKIKGETAARSLIRRAFHEDGNTCIVLDKDDLGILARGEIEFWSLLLREMQRFRFGGPRKTTVRAESPGATDTELQPTRVARAKKTARTRIPSHASKGTKVAKRPRLVKGRRKKA